jgi:hypothetical protein
VGLKLFRPYGAEICDILYPGAYAPGFIFPASGLKQVVIFPASGLKQILYLSRFGA